MKLLDVLEDAYASCSEKGYIPKTYRGVNWNIRSEYKKISLFFDNYDTGGSYDVETIVKNDFILNNYTEDFSTEFEIGLFSDGLKYNNRAYPKYKNCVIEIQNYTTYKEFYNIENKRHLKFLSHRCLEGCLIRGEDFSSTIDEVKAFTNMHFPKTDINKIKVTT